MGFFNNLIGERIKTEALKAIDKYAETAFINSVLPHCTDDGVKASMKLTGKLDLTIADMVVDFTEHMGKNTEKTLTIPLTEKHIDLDTLFRAVRPKMISGSETISTDGLTLTLNGKISGIGMKQMMMGVGATINSVSFRLTVVGSAAGTWLAQPAADEPKA